MIILLPQYEPQTVVYLICITSISIFLFDLLMQQFNYDFLIQLLSPLQATETYLLETIFLAKEPTISHMLQILMNVKF